MLFFSYIFFLFFNATATTEIYTLSLHDALPICTEDRRHQLSRLRSHFVASHRILRSATHVLDALTERSEEHTSELQSRQYLVCRLLLEKKNNSAGAGRCLPTRTNSFSASRGRLE